MFVSFKHETKLTSNNYYMGFGNNINPDFAVHFLPHLTIKNNKFALKKSASSSRTEPILTSYQNKNLMLWFVKNGSKYSIALYPGYSNITETLSSLQSFQANRLLIYLPYYIYRIGFSENAYDLNGKEYWKIVFIAKSKGTYLE